VSCTVAAYGLRVRPVYYWAMHRLHAHMALRVLGLWLAGAGPSHACQPYAGVSSSKR
jgi:hypothetical protein